MGTQKKSSEKKQKVASSSGKWIPVKKAKSMLSGTLAKATKAQIVGRGQDLRLRLFSVDQLLFDQMIAKGFVAEVEAQLIEQKAQVTHYPKMSKAG